MRSVWRLSLAHLRIPETDKVAIAGKLAAGVEFQRVSYMMLGTILEISTK